MIVTSEAPLKTTERILRQTEILGLDVEHSHLEKMVERRVLRWALKEDLAAKNWEKPWDVWM